MYCVQVLHSEGCIILGRLGFCHFLIEIFKRINYSLALGFKFMFSKFRGLFTLALKSSREDLPIVVSAFIQAKTKVECISYKEQFVP